MARTAQDLNRERARQIAEEVRSNPRSSYAGRFVGLVEGKVVVVTGSWDEVARRLLLITSDTQKCFCFEAGADDSEVEEIWELG